MRERLIPSKRIPEFLLAAILSCLSLAVLYFVFLSYTNTDLSFAVPLLLLVLAFFVGLQPTFFFYRNRKYFKNGKLKYLFFSEPEELQMQKQVQVEHAQQQRNTGNTAEEQKRREKIKIMETERERMEQEFYKVKKLGGWWIGLPSLVLFIYIIYAIYEYHTTNTLDSNWFVIFAIIGAAIIILNSAEEYWTKVLEAKHEIQIENPDYKFANIFLYDSDYIYTDSSLKYYSLMISKLVCYLATILFFVLIGILLFAWLGSISIAPTTIIIILLIIIILNQNKNKQ